LTYNRHSKRRETEERMKIKATYSELLYNITHQNANVRFQHIYRVYFNIQLFSNFFKFFFFCVVLLFCTKKKELYKTSFFYCFLNFLFFF
jgi:hypothetical protein